MSRLPEHWHSFNTCHDSSRGKGKVYWQMARLQDGNRFVPGDNVIHGDHLFCHSYRFDQKQLVARMDALTHNWYGAINGGKSLCGRFEIRAHGSSFPSWSPSRVLHFTEMWSDGKLVRRTSNTVLAFNWLALKCGVSFQKQGENREEIHKKTAGRVHAKVHRTDAKTRCSA